MKFTERLAASPAADRKEAKQLCALFDLLDSMRCYPPGERELAEIIGLSRYKLRLLLDDLNMCGVIEVKSGSGRAANKYGKPAESQDLNSRRKAFRSKCYKRFKTLYTWEVLDKFCNYWTEADIKSGLMRYEMQPTFEIAMRLARFEINGALVKPAETIEEMREIKRHNDAVNRNLTKKMNENAETTKI